MIKQTDLIKTSQDSTIEQESSLFVDLNSEETNQTMGGRYRTSSRRNSKFSEFFEGGILARFFGSKSRSQRESRSTYHTIDAFNGSNIGNNNIFNILNFFS